MEVIFIKDLRGQDGYAENYLIKNGYAVIKTKENLQKLENDNKKKAQQDAENKKEAEELQKKLKNVVLEFKVKTGEGDKVFGSISVKQIKDELSKQGYKIEKSQIELSSPIASLGFHNVAINLYPGVEGQVKVHVIK